VYGTKRPQSFEDTDVVKDQVLTSHPALRILNEIQSELSVPEISAKPAVSRQNSIRFNMEDFRRATAGCIHPFLCLIDSAESAQLSINAA